MRTVLFDAAPPDDDACRQGLDALRRALTDEGCSVRGFPLSELPVAPCRGCFACWTSTPGCCPFEDASCEAARAVAAAGLLAVYSPVFFGAWSYAAKKALDRMICLVSPHFSFSGLTRHRPRYASPPALLGVGWQGEPDPEAAGVFTRLVARNAYNLHAPEQGALLLAPDGWSRQRQLCRSAVRGMVH